MIHDDDIIQMTRSDLRERLAEARRHGKVIGARNVINRLLNSPAAAVVAGIIAAEEIGEAEDAKEIAP